MADFYSINSNEIIIKVAPVKRTAVIIFFSTLIFIGFVIPLLALTLSITDDVKVKPTILFSFGIFWGVSFYLLRILSWQLSGQEKLIIERDKATLTAKSNRFTFNEKIISSEKIIFSAIPARLRQINGKEIQTGKLVIRNADNSADKVISDIEIPNNELHKLIGTLNSLKMTLTK